MRVLVIGSGGREHALCWKIAQSPLLTELYCAPGNPGIASCARNVDISADDLPSLRSFAKDQKIDLTMVGPEQPLCQGIVDEFQDVGLPIVGPTRQAAQIEGSKAFAKQLMVRCGIATAPFVCCERVEQAYAFIDDNPRARVVKADGLAAGKGVVVAVDADGAKAAAHEMLTRRRFGDAGARIVVEEKLTGEEVSVIALTDGRRIATLASSQDHKAALDGDRGPNTGGMGAYSPAPVLSAPLQQQVEDEVLKPLVAGLAEMGHPFRGVLYAGLMLCDGRPQVLEFNCRFGDPETQPLLLRLQSDLLPYLRGVACGELPQEALKWDKRAAVCVVMTAGGYPGSYRKGSVIEGCARAEALEDVTVFQAGTRRDVARPEQLLTAGGRVLGVTALGANVAQARSRAYEGVSLIRWEGVHYRRDIGGRAS